MMTARSLAVVAVVSAAFAGQVDARNNLSRTPPVRPVQIPRSACLVSVHAVHAWSSLPVCVRARASTRAPIRVELVLI